jgi:DnaJ-class molecular chaperone
MELNPGEIICDQCNGTGKEYIGVPIPRGDIYNNCPKCQGVGKLDWIEAVVGKKTKNNIFNGATWMEPNGNHPSNPQVGQAYINTNNNEAYVYDGNTWVQVVSSTTQL